MLEYAIDFGSSNVVIYKKHFGIVLREPSLVAFEENDKVKIIKYFGAKAKKMLGKTDNSIHIVSPIKNGVIVNEELAYKLLSDLLKKVHSSPKVMSNFHILFCVPCGITELEIASFKNVAYRLGAGSVSFVPTVVTSLVGAGVNISKPSGYLSINLGGGTSSVAAVSLNSIINGVTLCVGGNKMDEAICRYLEQFFDLEISLHTAEKIKNDTCSLFVHDTSSIEISGIDINTKSPRTEIISSKNVRQALEFYFEKVVTATKLLLNNCSPDIVSDIALNGIYVSGGVSGMSGLENYLRKNLNLPVIILEDGINMSILGGGKLLSDKKLKRSIISKL